jgi:putative endonuclease
MNHDELGLLGEKLACKYLVKNGYKIIDKNWRYGRNEIDIVAEFNDKLIIVEVKTRQTAEIGEPWRAVTKGKQKTIIKVAHAYLVQNEIDLETQFDIISIVYNSFRCDLEHIQCAFTP